MCLGDSNCPTFYGKLLQRNEALRNKLVLHRGWHSLDATYKSRPLENTRQAYLDGVKAGALFAECDVWVTKDNILVLSHDSTFASMAAEPEHHLAVSPIAELEWSDVSQLKLKDGSAPVRLDRVLEDLCGTQMRLVIELKTFDAATQLGYHLAKRPELVKSVAWVMSFSLITLERFAESGGTQMGCRSVWILDNPVEAYDDKYIDEGETTFPCSSEGFRAFLERVGVKELFQRLQCGLYLQYNPCVTPWLLSEVRAEMISLLSQVAPGPSPKSSRDATQAFLGLWSDVQLDASFDRADVLAQWVDVVDVINTDMPSNFWPCIAKPGSVADYTATHQEHIVEARSECQDMKSLACSTESTEYQALFTNCDADPEEVPHMLERERKLSW